MSSQLARIDGLPTPTSHPVAEAARPSEMILGRDGRPVGESAQVAASPPKEESPQAPAKPAEPESYQVVAGDTLWSISRRHGLSMDSLIAANGLKSHTLAVGQSLKLAGGSTAPSARTANAPARMHEISPGDTLWSLSQRYKTSVDSLMAANAMSDSTLALGRRLRIP